MGLLAGVEVNGQIMRAASKCANSRAEVLQEAKLMSYIALHSNIVQLTGVNHITSDCVVPGKDTQSVG